MGFPPSWAGQKILPAASSALLHDMGTSKSLGQLGPKDILFFDNTPLLISTLASRRGAVTYSLAAIESLSAIDA